MVRLRSATGQVTTEGDRFIIDVTMSVHGGQGGYVHLGFAVGSTRFRICDLLPARAIRSQARLIVPAWGKIGHITCFTDQEQIDVECEPCMCESPLGDVRLPREVSLDHLAGAAYIQMRGGEFEENEIYDPVVLDRDANGTLLGLELLEPDEPLEPEVRELLAGDVNLDVIDDVMACLGKMEPWETLTLESIESPSD